MSPVHCEAVVGVVGRGEVGDGAAGQPQGPAHRGHHTGEHPALAIPGTDTAEALVRESKNVYSGLGTVKVSKLQEYVPFEEQIQVNVLDQVKIQCMKEHNTSESTHTFKSKCVSTGTGWPILLATPPKKTESQTWGEEKKRSPRTASMSGTLFFWGVARRIGHPVCARYE